MEQSFLLESDYKMKQKLLWEESKVLLAFGVIK